MQPFNHLFQNKLQPYNIHLAMYLMMAFKIMTASAFANNQITSVTIENPFYDSSAEVLKINAMSCEQLETYSEYCANGLINMLQNSDKQMRQIAAAALSIMARYANSKTATEDMAVVLMDRGFNDADENVRMSAIKGYIKLPVSEAMKINFLKNIIYREQQAVILTTAQAALANYPIHQGTKTQQTIGCSKSGLEF